LVIVGNGPEERHLRRIANSNIQFLGRVELHQLRELYQTAAALIQPGEEDFGINVVEAEACGCPVIAYGRGGATETIVDGETGFFFNDLTVESLSCAVDNSRGMRFNGAFMREMVLRFSPARFRIELQQFIQEKLQQSER
jgi:glycosyltransferase involved in cell wall biosynthesis